MRVVRFRQMKILKQRLKGGGMTRYSVAKIRGCGELDDVASALIMVREARIKNRIMRDILHDPLSEDENRDSDSSCMAEVPLY